MLAKNLDAFVSVESCMRDSTRLRFGLSLDCLGLFKARVGVETRSHSARAYMGISFKGCSITVTFYELYEAVTTNKKAIFFLIYAGLLCFLGFKTHTYLLPKEEQVEPTIQNVDLDELLKGKAEEKYLEETNLPEGLVIHSAIYGEMAELEQQKRAREGGDPAEPIDLDRTRDLTVPFRFWVNRSGLHLPKGNKPFIRKGLKGLTHPAVLVEYEVGKTGRRQLLARESDEINLGIQAGQAIHN
jgi:hypothetical protein